MITYRKLRGKRILVGLTYTSASGTSYKTEQFCGVIERADKGGITIRKPDGDLFELPPDLKAVQHAQPGEYILKTTQEVVINPDFLTTWTITSNK
ncbi:MAG: hypothetical protein ACI4DP_09060 [Candidatus Ornithomonoglobus sp.]